MFRKHAQRILFFNALLLLQAYVSFALDISQTSLEFLPDGWQAKIFPPTSSASILWQWVRALLAPMGLLAIAIKLGRIMEADRQRNS